MDNAASVQLLAAAVESIANETLQDITVDVVLEINVGQNRCGVEPGETVLEVVQQILKHGKSLRFKGIQAYHG